MNVGANIKKLRTQKGLSQKQVSLELNISVSYYSKIEAGTREPSISMFDQLGRLFGVTIDGLVHLDENRFSDIKLEDKPQLEQMNMIQQLEDEDKQTVLKIINTMLTKKKMKALLEEQISE